MLCIQAHARCHLQPPGAPGNPCRVHEKPGVLLKVRFAGTVPMPGDLGKLGDPQASTSARLRQPSQHRPRPSTGEQHNRSRRSFARGKMKICKTNYWRRRVANGWTSQRRARQAALVRQWQPWEQSTGPRTLEGKVRASQNAYKGGMWWLLRELARAMRKQRKALERIET
jgi:hypothetical protein